MTADPAHEFNPLNRFDVWLSAAWQTTPVLRDEYGQPTGETWIWQVGNLYVGLPLQATRRLLTAIVHAHGRGAIVPSEYRTPLISRESGRIIAQREFEHYRKSGHTYVEVPDVSDDALWWQYTWLDKEAQDAGVIPGAVYICIDKLDGHVRKQQDYDDWGALFDDILDVQR